MAMSAEAQVPSSRVSTRNVTVRRTILEAIPLRLVRITSNGSFRSQGQHVGEADDSYRLPTKKIPVNAIFCLLGILRRHTTGMGSTSIARSVIIFGTLMPCQ